MQDTKQKLPPITAHEVANYVVCPEAWRLKFMGKGQKLLDARAQQGQELRRQWVEKHDLSASLRSYAKTAYLLLLALVIVVFIWEHRRTHPRMTPNEVPAHNPPNVSPGNN